MSLPQKGGNRILDVIIRDARQNPKLMLELKQNPKKVIEQELGRKLNAPECEVLRNVLRSRGITVETNEVLITEFGK